MYVHRACASLIYITYLHNYNIYKKTHQCYAILCWCTGYDSLCSLHLYRRKKKKRSRLESEVEEQLRLEAKLRMIDTLSPNSRSPTKTARVTLTDISGTGPSPGSKSLTYSCHYCGITFKYKKVSICQLVATCCFHGVGCKSLGS